MVGGDNRIGDTLLISSLSIHGLRGFGNPVTLEPSIPNGQEGSGLTFIVGPNNSGKTTITEAIRMFNGGYESPSFSEGKRNAASDHRVTISMTEIDESHNHKHWEIKTHERGGSATETYYDGLKLKAGLRQSYCPSKAYVLKSRRFVPFEFGRSEGTREDYLGNNGGIETTRDASLTYFESRIHQMDLRHKDIDCYLKRVMGSDFEWRLEQRDSGSFYINFKNANSWHSIEGAGDGIWSIFTICDALYDASAYSTIVIDEPELSLHPSLQKRILKLLLEESKSKQILVMTHSPYLVSLEALNNGGTLFRTSKDSQGNCRIRSLSMSTAENICRQLRNLRNPHSFGMGAVEAFFLSDNVIVCEGQDDVIYYDKFCEQVGTDLYGEFFSWGAGGVDNISLVLTILQELGFEKVVAIFDGDKEEAANRCVKSFPHYKIIVIPENDVRDKEVVKQRDAVKGLADEKGQLKSENLQYIKSTYADINAYFGNGLLPI